MIIFFNIYEKIVFWCFNVETPPVPLIIITTNAFIATASPVILYIIAISAKFYIVAILSMHYLFFYDPEFLEQLPLAQRQVFGNLVRELVLPKGRPFFLGDDGLVDQELDGFCAGLLSINRQSAYTWAAYARAIDVYLRYMAAQGKDWKNATRSDLTTYFTVRTTVSFQSSRPLKSNSWNVAANALKNLYEYGLEEGLVSEVPFRYRKSRGEFARAESKTVDILAKTTPEPINFISLNLYKHHWRKVVIERQNSARNLALDDLLISTGLRISEAMGLQVHQIPDPDAIAHAGRKTVSIRVVGKGKKPRTVRIPKRTVRALRFYIAEERQALVEKISKKKGKIKSASSNVFLSREGNPLRIRTVENRFNVISKQLDIKLTPHGCRHTFAIYQLSSMIKRMASNLNSLKSDGPDAYRKIMSDPLRELQRLLGHSSILTTYIYLDFIEECEILVDESMADWTQWENENGR